MAKTKSRAELLLEAGQYAVAEFKPENDITKCNFAAHYIASKLGFGGFYELMANQIVERMTNAPDFAVVTGDVAQALANDGKLVVAGIIDHPHGHVAVCAPGTTCYSGKWREKCPMVANVGAHNGMMTANYAFLDKPQYYAWVETPK